MTATTVYTTSSASGDPEEPLPSETPRDDLEAAQHGGRRRDGRNTVPVTDSLDEDEVSTTHVTDSLGREQSTYIISESGLVLDAEQNAAAKDYGRELTHRLHKAQTTIYGLRREARRYRLKARAAQDELQQARATIAHLRGIADVITEHEPS
ncbi:hypothetical protein [Nesterenkonia xinjiangensis]|uniref:Uncharacterized protein n=1 Tax=Nesterenkonia xinjiangensis TaxID=225327 RepID=A0A7Z0GLL1_9MICC|nr:hypothetical protein [Nesterenkonia xinjiangensis]NYJ78251.1 hypothetical protein [Nesterenkonia xinjiangensis]